MKRPETQYVAVGEVDIGYQVLGSGPPDVLFCYGLGSNIEMFWDVDFIAQFWSRVADVSRLIVFDRRGTGVSASLDVDSTPSWEQWAEDLGAVLDAVSSEQAVIVATLDAGPIAMLFAALRPQRVSGLVLINTAARSVQAPDYPYGFPPEAADEVLAMISANWGTFDFAALANPGTRDKQLLEGFARQQRMSASPRTAVAQYRHIYFGLDARDALPLIQAPTLVLHVKDSPFVPIEHGQYLAEHIPGARFEAVPGADLGMLAPEILDCILEYLTGERPAVEIESILATVMFTDIVGSTEHAAKLGDSQWLALLDAHERIVRAELRRFKGHEVKTVGDGFVASFDGPGRAIRCALAIHEAVQPLGLQLRIGMHTGECTVRGDDLGGLAVHIAARVGALATAGEVVVSSTVKDLVAGSGIGFDDRGDHELKGVPGTWRLFAVSTTPALATS